VKKGQTAAFERMMPTDLAEEFGGKIHTAGTDRFDAEAALLQAADSRMLHDALDELPVNFREALVLRELEGMSYKEIAEVMEVPLGTVMSGVARGRGQLWERPPRARDQEVQLGMRR
jgi:RNA polymerase sigma-70 factor (ECF subfamily)